MFINYNLPSALESTKGEGSEGGSRSPRSLWQVNSRQGDHVSKRTILKVGFWSHLGSALIEKSLEDDWLSFPF